MKLAAPAPDDATPREYPGIHNAVAFHDGFVSGSAPEGDDGLESLKNMGFKTIISVDGAMPEVDKARAHGLRYIHLPIGYNGFDEKRKLQLVRATRDAMTVGPVYIHCHHGKHRSAGAAATIATCLGWETADDGIARMKIAGTSPAYRGLYACAASANVVSMEVLDDVPGDFPERWQPSNFVEAMVEIDEAMEHLKQIAKAGWKTPANHPDLVPAAEAGRIVDHMRTLGEGEYVQAKGDVFAGFLSAARGHAQELEDGLTQGTVKNAARTFEVLDASCKACHAKFRD